MPLDEKDYFNRLKSAPLPSVPSDKGAERGFLNEEYRELILAPQESIDNLLKIEKLKLKIKNAEIEKKLRIENAQRAYHVVCGWSVFIGIFILLSGFKITTFSISETSFMFVCGTLTVSMFLFYLTVIRNLFPNQGNSNVE